MSKVKLPSRLVVSRIALFTVIGSFLLIFTAAGTSAAGFSFMNSVKGFLGFAGAPTTIAKTASTPPGKTASPEPALLTAQTWRRVIRTANPTKIQMLPATPQPRLRPRLRASIEALAPVVRFDVSPALRDMDVIPPGPGKLRENEDRDNLPWKIRFAPEWDPVVQSSVGGKDGPGGTEISGPIVSFNAQPNSSGVVTARPDRCGRSKPHRHDGQPELPDLQQNGHVALWPGGE